MPGLQITLAGQEAPTDDAPFESIHELRRIMGRLADLVYKRHGHDRLRLFDVLLGILAAKIHDETAKGQPLRAALRSTDARLKQAFRESLTEALAAIGCSPSAVDVTDDMTIVRDSLEMLAPFSFRKTIAKGGAGEVLGTFYQEVVSSTFRGSLGAYFTPKPIADLAVGLCRPKPGDLVLDPSCGSGTFLLSCLEYARAQGGDPAIFGVDIQERMALTASLNAHLHGAESNIIHGDGLLLRLDSWKNAAPSENAGFSLIVGNPPFAGHADSTFLPYPATGSGQVNKVIPFVARAATHLAPGGRAALVLPVSVANAESEGFRALREWLRTQVEVEAIIGFTRDAFIHTDCGVEGILLVFRRPTGKKPDLKRRVYFRELINLGYDRQGRAVPGSEIPDCIAEFHAEDTTNHFVPLSRLYGFDRWDPLWIRNQLLMGSAVEGEFVQLTELCSVVKRTLKTREIRDDKEYPTFELADVDFDSGEIRSSTLLTGDVVRRKNRLRIVVKEGDILLPNHRDSLIARTGKFVGRSPAIVTAEQDGHITSNRFIVLRAKVDRDLLVYVLNTALVREQLKVLARGSASLDIRDKVLVQVKVPTGLKEASFVKRVRDASKALAGARATLSDAEAAYRDLLQEAAR